MTVHLDVVQGECWICGCDGEHGCLPGCWRVPDPTRTGDLCSSCVKLAVTYQLVTAVLKHPNNLCRISHLAERTGVRAAALQIDIDYLCGHGLLERAHVFGETVYRLAAAPAGTHVGGLVA